jgi:hypothetical protein
VKLIREEVQDVQYLTEGEGDKKSVYITGVALQASVPNGNRRFYPESVLDREVGRYTKELIEKNRAYGELGHPEKPGINLDRVSHMIKELKKDGSNWIIKAKLIDTPMGNIAKSLIAEGASLGVSSRGMGTLKEDKTKGYHIVQDDFHLAVGADIVANPSAPDAFVQGIMENVEWYFDASKGTWAQQMVEPMNEALHKMTITEINENKVRAFKAFIEGLANPLNESIGIKTSRDGRKVVHYQGKPTGHIIDVSVNKFGPGKAYHIDPQVEGAPERGFSHPTDALSFLEKKLSSK